MFKLAKKLLIVLVVSVLMISMVTATVHAVSTPKTIDKKDTEIVKIESKEKTTKYKITWNGNGGKIGSKKTVSTTVKKGSKIGKLVTPKRSGYRFKGWYTKKTGGTRITKNSKPRKSATLFAQWTKKTTSASKIVGSWIYISPTNLLVYNSYSYTFNKNGTFFAAMIGSKSTFASGYSITAKYKVSGKNITFTNVMEKRANGTIIKYPTAVVREYQFVKYGDSERLKMAQVTQSYYRAVSDGSIPFYRPGG